MVSNIHQIELYINNQLIELESQSKLNLRINNVMWNPTKVTTQTGEYSYSFNIPSTPNNDKILDYANNFAKLNKFHTRYNAQLYADGSLIFDGSLTIKKFKNKMYQCNLVNIKADTLEEIFGDSVMTDMEWLVDYSGTSTINEVNGNPRTKYFFPLVSYGAFTKVPNVDNEGTDNDYYTSKFVIDKTNRFLLEDFYPSLNMVETIKKCFENKGYTVQGDALTNHFLNEIYCSTSLAEGQDPPFNVGNPKFGQIKLRWVGLFNINESDYTQDLKFPYYFAGYKSQDGKWVPDKWNFDQVTVTNLLNRNRFSFDKLADTNMISNYKEKDEDPYEIEIPADGFYRITLSAETLIDTDETEPIQAWQWTRTREKGLYFPGFGPMQQWMGKGAEQNLVNIPVDMATTMPFEIQVVKGSNPSFELIGGKNKYQCLNGYPTQNQVMIYEDASGGEEQWSNNHLNIESCYPHEQLGRKNVQEHEENAVGGINLTNNIEITNYDVLSDSLTNVSPTDYGYANAYRTVMCYDPAVNENFICGITTMGNKLGSGAVAFTKNGYSWSRMSSTKNYSFYNQTGYLNVATRQTSDLNANSFADTPQCFYQNASSIENHIQARVDGMTYLKKGEKIGVYLLRRALYYEDGSLANYKLDILRMRLYIEAATPQEYAIVKDSDFGWNTPTKFSTQLNLFNFTNRETKVSDWLKNVGDAFNLSYSMAGNTVTININKGLDKDVMTAVDLDDRVSSDSLEAEYISYPKEMSIQYNIDDEERGFYASVPSDKIDLSTWKDYADRGYSVIKLNDDSYETTSQNKNLQFSYTWYDSFTWYSSYDGANIGTFRIPIIAKDEYMINEIKDDEAQEYRGYQLPQRFWYRNYSPFITTAVPTAQQYIDIWNDAFLLRSGVRVYAPTNKNASNVNLSYKNTEKSLITELFDINPMLASNYLTVEAFINPQEYIALKGGALAKVDDDLYYVSQIQAFDPTGNNPTKLKLVKKV